MQTTARVRLFILLFGIARILRVRLGVTKIPIAIGTRLTRWLFWPGRTGCLFCRANAQILQKFIKVFTGLWVISDRLCCLLRENPEDTVFSLGLFIVMRSLEKGIIWRCWGWRHWEWFKIVRCAVVMLGLTRYLSLFLWMAGSHRIELRNYKFRWAG